MINISSPRTVREILDKYSLTPLKKFGQNFLIDENIVRRIAQSVNYESGCVMEIGAGLGALTAKLAERAKKVLVYEIDRGLCGALSETLEDYSNITLLNHDVLKADIKDDTQRVFNGKSFFIAANLPYYITSPCIMRILEEKLKCSGMVLMMQKEVAQRLTASPGSAEYGAITAAVSFFAIPQVLFDVSKNCFYPKPDVSSAVVSLTAKPYDESIREEYLQLVKGLFAMRRKTIFNNLVMQMGLPKDAAQALLYAAGIEPQRRAETLSSEDFIHFAYMYKNLKQNDMKKKD